MNNILKYLKFKLKEENNNINYLDLSIHRHNNNLYLGIHRKPTRTDTTIHLTSNHQLEHKHAAYIFHIKRMMAPNHRTSTTIKKGTLYLP
jgi:hypothetical protein